MTAGLKLLAESGEKIYLCITRINVKNKKKLEKKARNERNRMC